MAPTRLWLERLPTEVLQKLQHIQPQTVGQAQRIPGMTSYASPTLRLVHLERMRRNSVA
ncbi:hypothetical protein [Xylella fastidiosa]|uniref:hypothetical protein n=1 Tax=Xylella fastidiosa TaxID=2371 RepID=UPI00136301BD|nr:hypothetical protein [Xylella fastidiosa subsp. fastidiosa]